jgi:hypothetical protein
MPMTRQSPVFETRYNFISFCPAGSRNISLAYSYVPVILYFVNEIKRTYSIGLSGKKLRESSKNLNALKKERVYVSANGSHLSSLWLNMFASQNVRRRDRERGKREKEKKIIL